MIDREDMFVGLTFKELLLSIPKLSDEMLCRLLAFTQLEARMRVEKGKG